MANKRPDKFKRWMIASFFLIPLFLFGSIVGYRFIHRLYRPAKMKVLIQLLCYRRTDHWAHNRICDEGENAVPYLIKGLGDKNPRVRVMSAGVLRDFAAARIEAEKAVPKLIELLSDTDESVRWMAASALAYFADKRAVPGLIKLLSDPQPSVRGSAAYALGKIAPDDAVGPLIQTLFDPEIFVRTQAVEALDKIGSPKAVGPLIACLEQEKPPGIRPGRWRRFKRTVIETLEKITGQSFGDYRRAVLDVEFREIIQKWLDWWEENKEKYK